MQERASSQPALPAAGVGELLNGADAGAELNIGQVCLQLRQVQDSITELRGAVQELQDRQGQLVESTEVLQVALQFKEKNLMRSRLNLPKCGTLNRPVTHGIMLPLVLLVMRKTSLMVSLPL